MQYSHRLIIYSSQLGWFEKVQRAYRNPKTYIYEIDLPKLLAANQKLKVKQRAIGDALFMLLEKENSPGQYYLTIIDKKDIQKINSVRWILKDSSNYWRTGEKFQKLHQFVLDINGRDPLDMDIHHDNFFTFDNRNRNLRVLSKSDHTKIHAPIIINDFTAIRTDIEFFDFIQTVL